VVPTHGWTVHRNVSPETIPALNKRIAILGSTGSIGRSALAVLENMPPGFEVVGLAAGSRWEALAEQVQRWRPRYAAISDGACRDALMREVPAGTEVLAGPSGLEELVERCGCDWVLSSIVGLGGLAATVKAVELGKQVAVANKEALVVAGPLLTRLARRSGADLIPVDSEHSAVFQAIRCGSAEEVQRIFLTSSGGPFRTWPKEQIASASVEQALHHPVWDMGPKITIDSATMMNKALEVVEARWLFDVPAERIEVLIHPEAIVHALVEFRDGSIIAQLGAPDMRGPIQYALTYPPAALRTARPAALPSGAAGLRCGGARRVRRGGAERGQRGSGRGLSSSAHQTRGHCRSHCRYIEQAQLDRIAGLGRSPGGRFLGQK
jgi:1-deoxy-D-xylulose-5-phosphate reductoisomerase